MDGSWWNGTAKFASHVPDSPGSPTPVPEPASMVLVASGLAAAAIRKRAAAFRSLMVSGSARSLMVSAMVASACLAGQVSNASADTFNWNSTYNYHYDLPDGYYGPITPIEFAWSFEFNPVVTSTDLQDNQPGSLRTTAFFSGAGLTTAPTPVTAGLWATMPAGATFTHDSYVWANQAYYSFCNCVVRDFLASDQWSSGDVNADPNVETYIHYIREFGLGTQQSGTAADVATFDALSIIDFLTATGAPGYTPQNIEQLRITTRDLTTGESSLNVLSWNGPGTFASHVPGSRGTPTPVPEPASMVLVGTGLLAAAAIRKRARARLC